MTYFKELGERVEHAADAGGKFAEAVVHAAGFALSGALAFLDREVGYAAKAMKARRAKPAPEEKAGKK